MGDALPPTHTETIHMAIRKPSGIAPTGLGRVRVGGATQTTPPGTSAKAQKRRTNNPVKWPAVKVKQKR